MLLVSRIVDIAGKFLGPRVEFEIFLWRLEKYRNAEKEYFLLGELVDRDRACIDVGANEGLYAGKLSKLAREVHCFEPIPWLADKLEKKLPRSVAIHRAAASSVAGKGVLRVPYSNSVEMHGTSTLEAGNPLPGSTHFKTIECDLVCLDEEIKTPVGFMKIDVEGHELSVLQGATKILRAHHPVLLIESERRHNNSMPQALFDFLKTFGYRGFFLREDKWVSTDLFNVDLDQSLEKIANNSRTYVNNFIFR